MTTQPLPPGMGAHLLRPTANPSLVFDRAFDGFEPDFSGFSSNAPHTKQGFLARFVERALSDDQHEYFEDRQARRRAAIEQRAQNEESGDARHAHAFEFTNATRLVLGLGLPNSVETGFLFDRLTGSPFLPGSSIKGLARAAARQVLSGEIDGDRDFWQAHLERLFGPPDTGVGSKTGEAIFYDAFPKQWPTLVVDLLNPHYTQHLENKTEPPADWHNPVPVPFLALETGACFMVYIGLQGPQGPKAVAKDHEDLKQLHRLLEAAFDDLGAGAKTSSGYGYLTVPGSEALATAGPSSEERAPEPVEQPPAEFDNIQLYRKGNRLLAYRKGKPFAEALFKSLARKPPLKKLSKAATRLLNRGELKAKITVIEGRIDTVLEIYE